MGCCRLLISKEQCYQRMNAQLHQRHEQLWTRPTTAIASLYRIAATKIMLIRRRQRHAARKIAYWYWQLQLRKNAKERAIWLKRKQRARQLCASLVSKSVLVVWRIWRQHTAIERTRKAVIAERVQRGLTNWISNRVVRIQRLHQLAMARRGVATEQLGPQLDVTVLRSLEELTRRLMAQHNQLTKRELCVAFYEQLLHDVSAWRSPEPHLRFLAKRYGLQLDALPATKIRSWLKYKWRHASDSEGFLDLHLPLPTRTLEFLAQLSAYYALEKLVSSQRMQVQVQYEVRMIAREYLALLYTNNQVLHTPMTTSSAQLRQKAVEILQRRDEEEWMYFTDPTDKHLNRRIINNEKAFPTRRHAFISFHSVWSDLCEKCLALQTHQSRTCPCCGHRHSEKSTTATPGHAAFQKSHHRTHTAAPGEDSHLIDPAPPLEHLPRLFRDQECCDFLVINAFFHALAPLEHENRTAHAPETIWKLAMTHAVVSIAILYDELKISSLDSLLQYLQHRNRNQPDDAHIERIAPPQVLDKLLLLGNRLYDELMSIEQELLALQYAHSSCSRVKTRQRDAH